MIKGVPLCVSSVVKIMAQSLYLLCFPFIDFQCTIPLNSSLHTPLQCCYIFLFNNQADEIIFCEYSVFKIHRRKVLKFISKGLASDDCNLV